MLKNDTAHPRVKICGITNLNDALFCASLGVEMIGLNLWPSSPRRVTIEEARKIIVGVRASPPGADVNAPVNASKIALVLVSPKKDEIRSLMQNLKPDCIQIHGEWSPSDELFSADDAPEIPPVMLMRAFQVGEFSDIALVEQWSGEPILIDAKVSGMHGGTGARVDLTLLTSIKKKYFLAGGLTPENVGDAIAKVQPYGVDVASGVEASPGRKSHSAVEEFVKAVRRQ